MLKRDITYENFDGEKVTETFYFNLTKTELLELQLGFDGGMEEVLRRIIASDNVKGLVDLFKKIVLASYGIRSEDGKRFMKSDEIREGFTQTAAYDQLFMELATDEDSAAAFVTGVVPRAFAEEIEKEQAKEKAMDVPLPLQDVPPTPPTE